MAKVKYMRINEDPKTTKNRSFLEKVLDLCDDFKYAEMWQIHSVFYLMPSNEQRRSGRYSGDMELLRTYEVKNLKNRLPTLS